MTVLEKGIFANLLIICFILIGMIIHYYYVRIKKNNLEPISDNENTSVVKKQSSASNNSIHKLY